MVFWGSSLFFKFNPHRIYLPGPTKFWKRRRTFRISSHYFGRKRNCWRLALRAVNRALLYATRARKLKGQDNIKLRALRVSSAAEELGMTLPVFKRGLQSSNVCLDNHSLADLSVWEPRTFQALGNFAWNNFVYQGFGDIKHLGDPPEGVILRGLKRVKNDI